MKFQTTLFIEGKGCISEIVRAESVEQAIERLISVKNIPCAESGYAHPLTQNGPKADDWRFNIRSSVTGRVTMSNKRPGKNPAKELTNQKKVALQTQ